MSGMTPEMMDEVLISRKLRELAELAASRGVPFIGAMGSITGTPIFHQVGNDHVIADLVLELAGVQAERESHLG